MDRMIENNQRFRNNNVKGKKKTKSVNKKAAAIAAIVIAYLINLGVTYIGSNNAASKYVAEKYGENNNPYHYIVSSNGDYFYLNGDRKELSDVIKETVNDLTKEDASLEEIYYYLDNNYGSTMAKEYKDNLKENDEKLHLQEFRNKVVADKKYDDIVKGRAK